MEETKPLTAVRITSEGKKPKEELVVREVPLTIILNSKELVTLLCTPSGLTHLAVGFLASEGLLKEKEDIKEMVLNEKGWYIQINVDESTIDLEALSSRRLITSGCAGVASFYRSTDARLAAPIDSPLRISRDQVFSLMKRFQQKSSLFRKTGGVHSCALGTTEEIQVFADDIGRHNAVDKVFGECLLKDISTIDKVLLTSGRVSSEILLKVVKRQVPIIISPAAPTDLATDLAQKLNLTVIGFVRGKRMNVYSAAERVI